MDKKEFLQGINKLELAYSRKFSKEQLILWYDKLKKQSFEKFNAKVNELIAKNVYMPSLAEFIEEPKKQYTNYEQRDLSSIDFSQFYANKTTRRSNE